MTIEARINHGVNSSSASASFARWWQSASPGSRLAAAANLQRQRRAAAEAERALKPGQHCRMCGASITVAGLPAHARAHAQRSRRAQVLAALSKPERQAELRRKARAILAADDWTVMFKAQRRLNQLHNERARMGFELTGDPTAFR